MTLNKKPLSDVWLGLLLAIMLGIVSYGLKVFAKSHIADPLVIALILGIIGRSVMGEQSKFQPGLKFAPSFFLPLGIIFYGAQNLNFAKIADVESNIIVLLIFVVLTYFIVILLLGTLLKQRKQITYLTAAGSAICGASAIAVTSPAVNAEPDDVSISLLSVALAALIGFSLILPFISAAFDVSCETHCLASGSVLQFTGLVKTSNMFVPFLTKDVSEVHAISMAVSVKALRYLGLLIVIPIFASLIRKKVYVPWFLWAFLAAGLLGTWLYTNQRLLFDATLTPYIKAIHNISWSIAMAAIGLNADVRQLISNNGSKAIIMAFAGFLAATITFFIGIYIISLI